MMYSNFHNMGFGRWMNQFSRSNPNTTLNIKIDYDDDIEIYSVNFHDELDNCIESFSYQDMSEVMDDLRESISQFSTLVKI